MWAHRKLIKSRKTNKLFKWDINLNAIEKPVDIENMKFV